jgi:hypothetical protein
MKTAPQDVKNLLTFMAFSQVQTPACAGATREHMRGVSYSAANGASPIFFRKAQADVCIGARCSAGRSLPIPATAA